ncbi:hypothetical protein BT93_L0350 [Corymbia citriodora subsp. variegata]|uniref:Amino acid transporter transmembrane domain-containing protein n=1 Tax=Corymbia citriodora subsp. variegata TaxID=360336 RepID=A0A8T0CUQ0_CORYI|nr:hypothetical protein BT93_L0350 [Corymbia citriodora subsp. variegata]
MHQSRFGFEVSPDLPRDNDGRRRRTGTVGTAIAHVITAVIESGVLSLAWATTQLGWIAGLAVLFLFSFITLYTSTLLADCYRTGDPVRGERNSTYRNAVGAILGQAKAKLCGGFQYLQYFGVPIVYTIAASLSMRAIRESICFHKKSNKSLCHENSNLYMIIFGVIEIILSQIPNFDKSWWLPIVAIVMSSTYLTIGIGLGIAKVIENDKFRGSLTGISIGTVTQTQKIWRSFQALGAFAFAFSYSTMLIEIQDTIRSPPQEAKTMKKAMLVSVAVITLFYMLFSCMGYAAFGDSAPGHLLAGFGFFNPYWLVDIANLAIVIHLVCSYQMFAQPLFASVEKYTERKFSDSRLITKEIKIPVPGFGKYTLYGFRLICRTIFVIVPTVISMLLPFFNDVIGLVGALGFWPLMVYFPVEMYITQMEIPRWSIKWISLQILSVACFIISIATAVGSIAGVVVRLKSYKPLGPSY